MEKIIKTATLPNSNIKVVLSPKAAEFYDYYQYRKMLYDRLCESDAEPTTRKAQAKEDMARALVVYHSELEKCQKIWESEEENRR